MLGIYSSTSVLNYKYKTHTYLWRHHPQAPLSLGCRLITHLNHHAQSRTRTYLKLRHFNTICIDQHPTCGCLCFCGLWYARVSPIEVSC